MKLLLDSGADKDKANENGWTPLYIAASYGHDQIVKLLLDVGVDINKADNDGWTPLITAVYNGHERCVVSLWKAGADIYKETKNGLTALSLAAKKGHDEIVKLLLDVTYNDIADKVLVAVSQQNIIFDTAFVIFKKTVENTITIEGFNIDDTHTHKKLYNIFQAKFSEM